MIHEKWTMDFPKLYQRYAHDVHRFSLYLSGNYALAEDLTAETFVQRAIGRIVSDTSFGVSPRKSIATAVIAALSWVVFFVMLFHGRREVLVRIRR